MFLGVGAPKNLSGMPRITQQASYFPITISQLLKDPTLIETWFWRKMIHQCSRTPWIPTNWNIINVKASNAHLSFFAGGSESLFDLFKHYSTYLWLMQFLYNSRSGSTWAGGNVRRVSVKPPWRPQSSIWSSAKDILRGSDQVRES